jgi:hypothetical protein
MACGKRSRGPTWRVPSVQCGIELPCVRGWGKMMTSGPCRFSNFELIVQYWFKLPKNKIREWHLPDLKKLWKIQIWYTSLMWTTSSIGPTSNSKQNFIYKFYNFLIFEFALNSKGIQTYWEKSQKFSKIIICQSRRNCNFWSPHLIEKFEVSLQWPLWALRKRKDWSPISANDLG